MPVLEAIKIARENNKKTYIGTACKHCGGKIRDVKYGRCVARCNFYVPPLEVLERKRWKKLLTLYGLDKDEWYWMLKEQNFQCKICKTKLKERKKGRGLRSEIHVDHDHKTMRVRGLLCNPCNSLLGYAKEDVSILNSAIIYVKEVCEINVN